ncbi:serine/threonine protein kinase [Allokutzneria albata]|uniref:non-specific serine/threonine protein kinase n=2 Tax=Allokutzneria albata TaxID=211114 RepID=A0A1H0CRM4_ALLAB|nr:Stk1 family PASTA domain-containing Ser/Thr kinase [Allokutzneria albata]SDN60516.1 serine/threonine protein kinase [Allokutzneria albata]
MESRGAELSGTLLERRYRIDTMIARGGMSSVYLGLDTRLERPVAIKVMDSRLSGDRSFLDRLEREARTAARLHHPSVVGVYDQGVDHREDGELAYLVMEYIEGGTLRDVLHERGELPIPLALSVLEPILAALAAAHEAALVHRDIKPENVLIGRGGTVKVGDFGLVKAIAGAGTTSDSVILGTVAYLAPEQVATGAADARSDVYSAGLVLFEMLTGTPPYTGDTALSVAYRHVNNDVPAPSTLRQGIPAELDELVVRATRRDPSVRPADATAFLNELRRVRTSLGIHPVPIPVPPSKVAAKLPSYKPARDDDPPTEQITAIRDYTDGPTVVKPRVPTSAGPMGTRTMNRSDLPAMAQRQPAGDPAPEDAAPRPSKRDRERARGRRLALIWSVVITVLVAGVGGTAWWLASGRFAEVPQLIGQSLTKAQERLRAVDLVAKVVHEPHDEVPIDEVIRSDPQSGSKVLRGNEVALVVSTGLPEVPQVVAGASLADAERAIKEAKLQPARNASADDYSAEVPEGMVLKLVPGPGTKLKVGAAVTVALSKGRPPVPVPSIAGMTKEAAYAELRRLGFEPEDGGQDFSAEYEAGRVAKTDPPAGTKLDPKSSRRVKVMLSNAVTVPNVTNQRAKDAAKALREKGLDVEIQHLIPGRDDGTVINQSASPGTRVRPGTKIVLTCLF